MTTDKAIQIIEDRIMIDNLMRDPAFISSVEETDGKVVKIYADWSRDCIVYEFLNGSVKESQLSTAIDALRKIKYLRD
jgi:hypothetical protein